jgi:hypothetical protein
MENVQVLRLLNNMVQTLDKCDYSLEEQVSEKLTTEKLNLVYDIEKIQRSISKLSFKLGLSNNTRRGA